MILTCKHISKSFGSIEVLKNVNLNLQKTQILTLLGDSGCGKSTLLRIIAGLEKSDSGELFINSKLICDKKTFTAPQKRRIAFVFQDYALFPHMNVEQNITFALKDVGKNEQKKLISNISQTLNITDLLHKNPHQLSGGQQQRIAIARALVLKPELLLLDEPFSNLDTKLKQNVALELRSIIKKLNIGAIMVTHNRNEALSMSDKIALLKDGVIEQIGDPKEIYKKPKSLYVASFMGDIDFFNNKAYRLEECIVDNCKGELKATLEQSIYEGASKLLHLSLENGEMLKVRVDANMKINKQTHISIKEFLEFE